MNNFYPQKIAAAKNGMIATQHYEATKIGAYILEQGGNAIDAAVAAAFALGICEPAASGLGGQTFLLIYNKQTNKTIAVDGSSKAPIRALIEDIEHTRELYKGYKATTVPSTPAVLEYALKRYGKKSLAEILEPVIPIAENGYKITELQNKLVNREIEHLQEFNAGSIFLNENQISFSTGEIFKQPALANTLKVITNKGIEDFYQGEIARIIESDMINNDGFIRYDDLAQIPYPIERNPLKTRYKNFRIMTFPPPGAGRALIEMFNILGHFKLSEYNPDTPKGALLLAETMYKAQYDRQDKPYDPELYHQMKEETMLSHKYAAQTASNIKANITEELIYGETTHLSAMDKEGNVVALTQSIERVFGSFTVNLELGFLYNNYMSAYELKDPTHPYYLKPNSSPWASVAPTIVFKGKKPYIALGSPGSERIISAILQVILRMEKQSPLDAVTSPRLHCSHQKKVSLESARIRNDIIEYLEKNGFEIDHRDPFSFYMGCVQLVMQERNNFIGVADLRRDGAAQGV